MATPEPALRRYLLDDERVVVAIRQHWGKVSAPVAAAVIGMFLALWVDASVPVSLAAVSQVTWVVWFLVVLWALWRLLEWRHDWFVATDKRLILTYGLLTRRIAMMPLTKVTDMSYRRSIPGRLLGYGQFIMESAGQDQALHNITWVPDPDRTYRAICAEMFGVPAPGGDGEDRLLRGGGMAAAFDPDGADGIPASGIPASGDPDWSRPGLESPSAVEEYDTRSRAVPLHHNEPHEESTYRSEDLRGRDESADTGPIPVTRPRRVTEP